MMKRAIISGLQGGLIGAVGCITVFAAMDFFFPEPDLPTVSLDTVELVGLMEVGPGVCQYDYMDIYDNVLSTIISDCPETDESN